MYKLRSQRLNNKSIKNPLLVSGLLALGIGVIIFGYKILQNEPKNFVIPVEESSSTEKIVTSKSDGQTTSPSSSPDQNVSSDKLVSNSLQNGVLKEPSGVFVSNHRPSLGDSPDLMVVQSVCSTTPGATCYIQFSKGDLIRKLPAQKTDSNGDAYWTWNVKESQLSEGSWTITAIAALGNQTKTVKDTIALEVQP